MKNTKGFALVEALLIFVIIGALAGVGWYVYQRQNTDEADDSYTYGSSTPTETEESEETLTEITSQNGYTISTTSFPETWKKFTCEGTETMFLLPPPKESVRCQSEDLGYVSFNINTGEDPDRRYDSCTELEKIYAEKKDDYPQITSRTCEETEVDGYKLLKQTSVTNGQDIFGVVGTNYQYKIVLSESEDIDVSVYYFEGENSEVSHVADLNKMVDSIKITRN